ncbi:hypothetical protein BpHYR1_015086 [Brachionus plicatilis]|uniref:Uncharacterized protein n=1 Tax=Brachionus plicatilis TaxID=10195 RepID=A0A3M7QAM3_BRAPC|nr:hypothetical protein BpHYR1_015086 [Brachionus plicatilis]
MIIKGILSNKKFGAKTVAKYNNRSNIDRNTLSPEKSSEIPLVKNLFLIKRTSIGKMNTKLKITLGQSFLAVTSQGMKCKNMKYGQNQIWFGYYK